MSERSSADAAPAACAPPRWLGAWLGALLAALFALNALHAWRLPIWGRNELAHFDRIERLSSLEWPAAGSHIGDAAFRATVDGGLAWKRPKEFDGTKAGMGADGVSYETHQPPAYYLLLAPTNAALRATGVALPTRVRVLRVGQLLFGAIAVAFLFAMFRELERSFGVARDSAWPVALALATFHFPLVATLGNDALSLPVGNATLWLCLRAWRIGGAKPMALAGFAAGASVLSKPTCLLLAPCWGLAWLAAGWRDRRIGDAARGALLAAPFAIPVAWFGANALFAGDALATAATLAQFERAPIDGVFRFARALLGNGFSTRHLGWSAPSWIYDSALPFLALANGAVGAATIFRATDDAAWRRLVACCALLFLATLATAYALNQAKPQVLWSGYRHYLAIATPCLIGLFALPFRVDERRRVWALSTLAAAFTFAAVAWAARLVG